MSCDGGGGGGYWMDDDGIDGIVLLAEKGVGFPYMIYKPPKNLLKFTTRELPLEEKPVLLLLVRLGEGEGVEDMRAARSSYRAWDSRGSWPKRPKAHGAAVDVGNRENAELEEDEDDIYGSVCCGGVYEWGCYSIFPLGLCVWRGGCREKCDLGEGHHPRVLISGAP